MEQINLADKKTRQLIERIDLASKNFNLDGAALYFDYDSHVTASEAESYSNRSGGMSHDDITPIFQH
jgi:hypothetical protein